MALTTNQKIGITVVLTGLVTLAIAGGYFGLTAKKVTDGGNKVVDTIAKPIKKVVGKA